MYHSYSKPTGESVIKKDTGAKSTFGEKETKPETKVDQSRTSKPPTEPGSSIPVFKKDNQPDTKPAEKPSVDKAPSTQKPQDPPVVKDMPKVNDDKVPGDKKIDTTGNKDNDDDFEKERGLFKV